jgi:hypothetical protein
MRAKLHRKRSATKGGVYLPHLRSFIAKYVVTWLLLEATIGGDAWFPLLVLKQRSHLKERTFAGGKRDTIPLPFFAIHVASRPENSFNRETQSLHV